MMSLQFSSVPLALLFCFAGKFPNQLSLLALPLRACFCTMVRFACATQQQCLWKSPALHGHTLSLLETPPKIDLFCSRYHVVCVLTSLWEWKPGTSMIGKCQGKTEISQLLTPRGFLWSAMILFSLLVVRFCLRSLRAANVKAA